MELRALGSHCPVPVFFVFQSRPILSQTGVQFSDGSLAKFGTDAHEDAEFFEHIPFELVYHDSPYPPEQRDQIVFHQHAEVVVPDVLDLTCLSHIWCRSVAEYQTLLDLLSPTARDKWSIRIGNGSKPNLFFRRWTFVEQVVMTGRDLVFHFNEDSLTPGPFCAELTVTGDAGDILFQVQENSLTTTLPWRVPTPRMPHGGGIRVFLTLDGHIAFSWRFHEMDVPF